MKISKDNWTVAVENHITEDTATTTYADTYSLTVSVSKFNATAGLTYIMMLNNSTTTTPVVCTADATAHTGTWTFTGLDYKTDSAGTYNVELYVAGTITSATAPVSGFTNYVAGSEDGSVFTFTATADEVVTP